MTSKSDLRKSVKVGIENMLSRLVEMSDWIGRHPELGSEEYKSSKLLADELEKHGFKVERGLLGMKTAFRATFLGKSGGPHIAFFAEYDAMPGVEHACGHNIIGTAAVGAAIAVSKLKDLDGELIVLGTPAEEGHGSSAHAKKRMVEAGFFDDIDVVMMIHPTSGKTTVSDGFLAITGITIEFKGKSTHASASPHLGVNALNAAVLMCLAVHANRQQIRRDANAVIHGIIKEGGLASNIIPDKAVLQFGVRSSDDDYIPVLVKLVENSARGAALSTGCEVEVTVHPGLKSNIRNESLEKLFVQIFKELGEEVEDPAATATKPPGASTDFANVTHVVPGIHPMIAIAPEGATLHSREFAEVTFTDSGHRGLEIGAKALAMAAVEILADAELLEKIKETHRRDEAEENHL